MKRYLVLGVGRQGRAIIDGLRKLEPDALIIGADRSDVVRKEAVLGADDILQEPFVARLLGRGQEPWDCVISALPYSLNEDVGKATILAGLRWVDLGGHVQTTDSLTSYALTKAKAPIATDIGLAPGLLNILTWQWIKQHRNGTPFRVSMYCGGLPVPQPNNYWDYYLTFDPNGLVNEYYNDIERLKDGRLVTTKECLQPLESSPILSWNSQFAFEMGATSGGAPASFLSALANAGILDAHYQTLRYPGHFVKALDRRQEIHNEHPGDPLGNHRNLVRLFAEECTAEEPFEDRVFLGATLHDGSGQITHRQEIHATENFTAMQIATAYPTAAVAMLMAHGHLDGNKVVQYQDIAGARFQSMINYLDILKAPTP
jgi:saccharopine dehydrogenase-like NADP-dependent oxidoreductase